MALFTAALPVFLYVKLKNKFALNFAEVRVTLPALLRLPLRCRTASASFLRLLASQNFIYFAIASILVAIVLSKQYIELCKQGKLSVDKKSKSSPSDTEASAWAVFYTNALFLVRL